MFATVFNFAEIRSGVKHMLEKRFGSEERVPKKITLVLPKGMTIGGKKEIPITEHDHIRVEW